MFAVQISPRSQHTQPVQGVDFYTFQSKKKEMFVCDIIFTSKETSSLNDDLISIKKIQFFSYFFLKINTEAFLLKNLSQGIATANNNKKMCSQIST